MALMPVDTRLLIERAIEDVVTESDLRGYLGLSAIGEECSRLLWYGFRQCFREKIVARQKRLFGRGHKEEPIIQADLRKAGCICHVSADNQPEVVCGHGHMKGHIDDLIDNIPDAPKTRHLGEYKTSNTKYFKEMVKKGVKVAKPMHYAQMVCYMHLLGLSRALYIMVCKETDQRHYERISCNTELAKELIQKGVDIITVEKPPAKIGGPEWYSCKWCAAYEICHFNEPHIETCRTCKNVALCDDGKWNCDAHDIDLTFAQQLNPCKAYTPFDCFSDGE